MSGNRPKLELAFQSFRLSAEGPLAIAVVRWPVRILLVTAALCLVVAVFNFHPISWAQLVLSWLASLL
jgi:hypothetical protein